MKQQGVILIGVDQGTSFTKAIAIDADGRRLANAKRPIAVSAAPGGGVQQCPQTMLDNVVACISEIMQATGARTQDIVGLGLCNQTETLVVWDRQTGRPAIPAMVWQCRRGSREIESLTPHESDVAARTGLRLDPTFTAAKLKWLFHHAPAIAEGLKSGRLLFGTVDTWLVWKLTAGQTYATDASNASRTMLFDIDRMAWDDELFRLFSLEIAHLPECRRSDAAFGQIAAAFFGGPIPLVGVLGDQQASLLGHGCLSPKDMKMTIGTGSFIWRNIGAKPAGPPRPGIIRTVAWQLDSTCYAEEGFSTCGGNTLDWLVRRFAIAGGQPELHQCAADAGHSAGLLLIPALQGLGAPWWRPDVRAAVIGLHEATTTGHIAHAGLEAICYQIRALLDAMTRPGERPSALRVDGGLTASRYFVRLLADVLGLTIHASHEASALTGAAVMAGVGAGVWTSLDQPSRLFQHMATTDPDAARAPATDRDYRRWLGAVEMLITHEDAMAEAAD